MMIKESRKKRGIYIVKGGEGRRRRKIKRECGHVESPDATRI
jgi:hypothetical protein